jgi:hypothetical protein
VGRKLVHSLILLLDVVVLLRRLLLLLLPKQSLTLFRRLQRVVRVAIADDHTRLRP